MASLFKPTYSRKDPKTGQTVKKKTKKWYGKYRDMNGDIRKMPLCTDKAAAQVMLNELVKRNERQQAGLTDPYEEARKQKIGTHLDAFKTELDTRNNTRKHIEQTVNRIDRGFRACGFERLDQLSSSDVNSWLTDKRNQNEFSIKTCNYYMSAFKQFGNWLVKTKRYPENPFQYLNNLNARVDTKRERRHLSSSEFEALLKAAEAGKPFRKLTGIDRKMLYLTAAHTGFRARELSSLKRSQFNLEAEHPVITVEAAYAKNRKQAVQPIRKDLAKLLLAWMNQTGRYQNDETVWSGSWVERSAQMIRKDLEAAEISYQDSEGRVFDFHALRHQFISNLAAAGVHPKVAQQLARHSNINLTMDRYTHLENKQVTDALDKLPAVYKIDQDEEQKSESEGELLVPMLVPASDFSCPGSSSAVSDSDQQPVKEETPKPINAEDLGVVCLDVSSYDTSSGGGTPRILRKQIATCKIQKRPFSKVAAVVAA